MWRIEAQPSMVDTHRLQQTRSAGLGTLALHYMQGTAQTTLLEMVQRHPERAAPLCEGLAAGTPRFRRRVAGARHSADRSWIWAVVASSTGAAGIGESHNSSRR